jgi:NTP pyrophosphatase (non-canonical NTP hydrolase)
METKDIEGYQPSLWIPISDPQALAALGKLAEEVNELGSVIARTIIQGLDGKDPTSGKLNIDALRDEIADVRGLAQLVVEVFRLDDAVIEDRAQKKKQMKMKWIAMLAPMFLPCDKCPFAMECTMHQSCAEQTNMWGTGQPVIK